jgi:3'-phosphoadenosine 5'-phosphosulfate sulfotransferase (PAPS reductase)/FAD synthetase
VTLTLGRKQGISDSATWHRAIAEARQSVPDSELDQLIDRTLTAIRAEQNTGKRIGWGWSGGKDSQALGWIMEQAGIGECVLAMSTGLEWPAMLQWLTDYMPPGCEVIAEPLDLPWLAAHPHMLFPQGANGSRWFTLIQHRAQGRYFNSQKLDLLALGRRRKDGNYVGPDGADRYTNAHGITRWSPLADWTHEQTFALIDRERLPLPPCYDWPRGFQVGTGPWPARQWTTSTDHGFEECWQIDRDVIRHAATVLPQAREWMNRTGRS